MGKLIVRLVIACVGIVFLSVFAYDAHKNYLNKIPEGNIVSKCHYEGYYYWVSTGKSGFMNYVPDSYSFTITDGNKSYSTSVTKEEYQIYNEGNYYKIN